MLTARFRSGPSVNVVVMIDRPAGAVNAAAPVHLSQSALSRLIGRLEQHGLVERCLCDLDRRGIYVTITGEGRRRHAEAVPTHRRVLAATLSPDPHA